ncbi:hypothetical protein R5R35_013221 [Gryllus longicercus]|uniref:Uncharacterized protein n=1 Tax=Gryllus longicercus TaxID=2509291 RepID=A0AAN9ZH34_9ORTH
MRRVLSPPLPPPLPPQPQPSANCVRRVCPQPRVQASLPDCVPVRAVGAAALAAAPAAAATKFTARRRAASPAGDSGQVIEREQHRRLYGSLPRVKTARNRECTRQRSGRQPKGGMYLPDYVLGSPAPKYFNTPPTHGVRSPELKEAIANLRRISSCVQSPIRSAYKESPTPVPPLQQSARIPNKAQSLQEFSPESHLKEVLRSLRPVSRETRRPFALCGSHQLGHKY